MLTALSPLDGRYVDKVKELREYFSEVALIKYRVMIEVEYLIALGDEPRIQEVKPISPALKKQLRDWYEKFSLKDAGRVKEIEKTTNHDVKAVEYFLKERMQKTVPSFRRRGSQATARQGWSPGVVDSLVEFIHFALTSEDTNNLAYTLMWRDAIRDVYLPAIQKLHHTLQAFAREHKAEPLLALTHGQPATPTTVGKEFYVFAERLQRQIEQLKAHKLLGKLSGATGTWSAHVVSYPQVNWANFSTKFISSFDLEPNLVTTQIESHDSLAESFQIVERINTILIDFTRDVWMYISRGVLAQKKKVGEVGSSTMPHKINPIYFENAEGNLGIANALFSHLAQKLPISRLQRDLSDSTVIRNQGVPLAHSLLAAKYIMEGMSRISIHKHNLQKELDDHWEVLAEAIQIVLRKVGYDKPYEKLKELTRGEQVGKKEIRKFIGGLDIPKVEKKRLLELTPAKYTGLASKLVEA